MHSKVVVFCLVLPMPKIALKTRNVRATSKAPIGPSEIRPIPIQKISNAFILPPFRPKNTPHLPGFSGVNTLIFVPPPSPLEVLSEINGRGVFTPITFKLFCSIFLYLLYHSVSVGLSKEPERGRFPDIFPARLIFIPQSPKDMHKSFICSTKAWSLHLQFAIHSQVNLNQLNCFCSIYVQTTFPLSPRDPHISFPF